MPVTAMPHPLSAPLAELIAARLRALADPLRIRLLDRLRDGDASVGELTEVLATTQQNVSKHLGVLLREGIVSRRKVGTQSRYAIADPGVLALCEDVCGGLRRRIADLGSIAGTGR
jgi:DNA-binding transcriptional ArsR family regulator